MLNNINRLSNKLTLILTIIGFSASIALLSQTILLLFTNKGPLANLVNWFEISVANIERALKFYAEVLEGDLQQMEMMGTKMVFLPMNGEKVGGSFCQGDGYKHATDGPKIYLNGGEDLNMPLAKVEKAGGKVVMPKTKK